MRALALMIVILVAASCGPVQYISQVTRRASASVAAAKAAGAEKYAPYEYTSAVVYLHKAREEEGYAHHQAAIRFGKKAEEMGKRAKELALEQSGMESQGDATQIDPSTVPSEAK